MGAAATTAPATANVSARLRQRFTAKFLVSFEKTVARKVALFKSTDPSCHLAARLGAAQQSSRAGARPSLEHWHTDEQQTGRNTVRHDHRPLPLLSRAAKPASRTMTLIPKHHTAGSYSWIPQLAIRLNACPRAHGMSGPAALLMGSRGRIKTCVSRSRGAP